MSPSTTSRLLSLALAAGVTFSVLFGIDTLAGVKAADGAPTLATSSTQRGACA